MVLWKGLKAGLESFDTTRLLTSGLVPHFPAKLWGRPFFPGVLIFFGDGDVRSQGLVH